MTQLGINLPSLIAYLVNFVILLGILYVFAFKPLLRSLDQRSERIRDSLAAADQAREEAANSQTANNRITTNMILAIAFAEALGIYSLIVAVILLFVV